MQPTGCAVLLQFEMCTTRELQKLCKEFAQFAALCRVRIFFQPAHDDSTRRPGQRLNCFVRIVAHGSIKPTDCRDSLHALHPEECKKTWEHYCTTQSTALRPRALHGAWMLGAGQGRLQVREHGIAHHKMHRDWAQRYPSFLPNGSKNL